MFETTVVLTMVRHATWYGLSVSNTDFGLFWDDTAVSPCDTVIRIWGKILNIYELCVAKQNSFIVDTTSFLRKFQKNGRFRPPWMTIDQSIRGVGLIRLSRHVT